MIIQCHSISTNIITVKWSENKFRILKNIGINGFKSHFWKLMTCYLRLEKNWENILENYFYILRHSVSYTVKIIYLK